MELVPCNGCRRHVRPDEARCPFCDASIASGRAGLMFRVVTASIAGATSVTLAACYGGPPVYGVDHGSARWAVDASPQEYITEFGRRARGAQCEIRERSGSLEVKCAEASLSLRPGDEHRVYVTCEEGSTPASCVAAFDRIRAAPAAPEESPATGPSTIAPPAASAP